MKQRNSLRMHWRRKFNISYTFFILVTLTLLSGPTECNENNSENLSTETKQSGENSNSSDSNKSAPLISLGILMLLFLGNTQFGGQNDNPMSTQRINKNKTKLETSLKDFGQKKLKISEEGQLKILSSLVPTVLRDPRRPAVFLFLKPEGEKDSDVLVDDIAKACTVFYKNPKSEEALKKFLLMTPQEFSEENVHKSFEEIHNKMKNNKLKVLLIKDIDQITTNAFLTNLHSYCDNDFAPHKKVSFLFSATIPANLADESQAKDVIPDRLRNAVFNIAWKDFEDDKRKALLARVGPNTIIIQN